MFSLLLARSSDDEKVFLIKRNFLTKAKAREEMLRDFSKRFDSDSECMISEDRIEVEMLGEKWTYEVSKL